MTFASDLRRFQEKVDNRSDEFVRDIVSAVVAKVDEASPVGDATFWQSPPPAGYVGGQFRASNVLSLGARDSVTIRRADPSGAAAVAENLGVIPDNAAGHIYWLQNNTPYARPIEDGTASPRQAPQGVYGLVAAQFNRMIAEATVTAKRLVP